MTDFESMTVGKDENTLCVYHVKIHSDDQLIGHLPRGHMVHQQCQQTGDSKITGIWQYQCSKLTEW